MQSHDRETLDRIDAGVRKAFGKRLMQVALLHRAGRELDPLHVYQFQELDLLTNITPPSKPPELPEILHDPDHPARVRTVDGPLLFIREESQVVVLEVAGLLLRPEDQIRRAALDYLKAATSAREPWLTSDTGSALESRSSDSESTDIARWRCWDRVGRVIASGLFRAPCRSQTITCGEI